MQKNNSYWHIVPVGPDPPEHLYVIVETPRGSKNKYEMSKQFPGIILDRVLHSSVVYPIEYGAVGQTLYDDGDPLDAMVLVNDRTYPGVVIKARPVGLMHMIDQGVVDNKVLTVAEDDPVYSKISNYSDLPNHIVREISHFFETYKLLEEKRTEVLKWEDHEKAVEEITKSIRMYKEKFEE